MGVVVCAGKISAYNCTNLTAGAGYILRVDTFLNDSATQSVESNERKALTGMSSHAVLLCIHVCHSDEFPRELILLEMQQMPRL